MKTLAVVVAVALAVVAAWVVDLLLCAGDLRDIRAHHHEQCKVVTAVKQHALQYKGANSGISGLEDGERHQNGNIIFTSQERYGWFEIGHKMNEQNSVAKLTAQLPRGNLILYNATSNELRELVLDTEELRDAAHFAFQPHGLSLIDSRSLFVVNHQAAGDSIDYITLDEQWTRASFVRSYRNISTTHFLNDVAALSAKEFFVTEWVRSQPGSRGYKAEAFLKRHTGFVKHCVYANDAAPPRGFRCARVDHSLRSPNGVSVVRDQGLLLVSESLGRQIFVYEIHNAAVEEGDGGGAEKGGGKVGEKKKKKEKNALRGRALGLGVPQARRLRLRNVLPVGTFCDNFNVDPVSGRTFAACHPQGLRFTAHAEAPRATKALSQVLELVDNFWDWREVLVSDSFSAASVAVATTTTAVDKAGRERKQKSIVLGAVFDDGVQVCPL